MRIVTSSILMAVLSGCSGSALIDEPDLELTGTPISFGCLCVDSVESRGQATTSANIDNFAVSATVYSSDGNRSLYFAHEVYKVSGVGGDTWHTVSGNVHYWMSDSDEYNFFAYTPSEYIYFAPGVVEKFVYSTPKNVLKQPDIVVATSISPSYGEPVQLNFTHPLAQVSIMEGEISRYGKIESITISGIIDHGEYNMLTGEWLMNTSDTDSFVWHCDEVAQSYVNLSGQYFNFFFVPQKLGAEAAITIAFVDLAGIVEIHRSAISGAWQAGHRYRYVISL